MSPYNRTRILFWVSMAVLGYLIYADILHLYSIVVLPIAYSIFISWAVFQIDLNFMLKSHNEGSGQGITLTFDDGPDPKNTVEVLEVLKKHQVKATFFCIGSKCAEHPELIKRIHEEGHLLGTHSYTHAKWIDFNRAKQWEEEITKSQDVIEKTIGMRPRFFRPPYGVTTPHMAKALKRKEVLSIGWNVRSLDTLNNNISEIIDRSIQGVKPGAIVLFHDNLEWSAEVLDGFLIRLKQKKLLVEHLDAQIKEEAYA